MGTDTRVPGAPGTATPHDLRRQHAPHYRPGAAGGWPPPPAPASLPTRARHALTIGRIAGIPLELHWSFLALVALVVLAQLGSGAAAVGAGLAWIAILFASVVVHELAHCVVARRRGSTVLGILLLPIGGMSRMATLPADPGGEAAVAAAGPAASLAIGAGALVLGALLGSHVVPPTLVSGSWWARVGWLNVLLGAFNLLPALPMDGGRILRATLARRMDPLAATRIATSVARAIAVGLLVVGFFADLWLMVIGVFVYLGASAELAQARAQAARRSPPAGPWWWSGPPPPWGGPPPDRGPASWRPPPEWGPPTGSPATAAREPTSNR